MSPYSNSNHLSSVSTVSNYCLTTKLLSQLTSTKLLSQLTSTPITVKTAVELQ